MLCLGCKSQLAKVDDLCFYHKNERGWLNLVT